MFFDFKKSKDDKYLYFEQYFSEAKEIENGNVKVTCDQNSLIGERISEKKFGFIWFKYNLNDCKKEKIQIKSTNEAYYLLGYPIVTKKEI